ncbi:hypothetical protein [Paremcibacter congregatus]|uniref:hypothetical protein n=1 Tax=Paremcibacter congregatus TaxID=2043170 RepID=UPI0030EC2397|tara:strand:- start:371 stop:829 length:459 start_codon:yes stop_codon:yes gene_type:complete
MSAPALVHYTKVADYRSHFERCYCRKEVNTHDEIRVFFHPRDFNHAFFESSNRDGTKDQFSQVRAERIDWIKATLANPAADRYQGWNARKKIYEPVRRVDVVYEDFVVVIAISKDRNGRLKGNFITCYQADNSIGKIRQSPVWDYQACVNAL